MNKKYSDLELLNMKQSNKIYSIDEIKEILKDTFKKFDINRAYIFGSYARSEATKKSDIDIIILGGNFSNFKDFLNFTNEIVLKLKKEVDVIREENYQEEDENEYFNLANKLFYSKIKQERIMIYS